MMTRRSVLGSPLAFLQPPARERLNILLILVDDLGATDFGCTGSRFYRTPNIDRLAAEGMRFTQAYSACTVCSPSRAAILTGKYPARLHLTNWIGGHNYPWARLRPPAWTKHLPQAERTLADALKPAGYATASIGKWHLLETPGECKCTPEDQGFDVNIGGTHRGQPPSYFSPYGIETMRDGPKGEYLTDRERMEAARFIEANRRRPFLVYLPHHTVHMPLQAKPEVVERYAAASRPEAPQRNATYAAMIDSLDENVGRLMRTLEETGVAERTVVLLTSDNGGHLPSTNTNLGLRSGKGSAYEGGVRVPLLVRWPGVTKAGSTCDVPVIGPDLYATALEAAGVRAEPGQVVDGASLVPLLRGGGSGRGWRRDSLFWHYPHYHPGGATPYSAVRQGEWKLIEFQEDSRAELYNLRKDPMEGTDLVGRMPGRAAELRRQLQAWRERVGAQMAVANPEHDPARAGERVGAQRRR